MAGAIGVAAAAHLPGAATGRTARSGRDAWVLVRAAPLQVEAGAHLAAVSGGVPGP